MGVTDDVATIQRLIQSGPDDGYYSSTSTTFSATASIVRMSASWVAWLRFTGLEALDGVEIDQATLSVTASSNTSTSFGVQIQAIKADNPSAPNDKGDIDPLPRTAASVSWTTGSSWSQNNRYSSPDFAAVLQELVDAGHLEDGVVMLVLEGTGSQIRDIRSYESSPSMSARLDVTYTANTPPQFTAQPVLDHGSGYTHIGPNNPNAQVTFTTTDNEQGNLAFTVNRGALVVKSGWVHTGARSITLAHDDPNLIEGNNTLTLTIDDERGGVAVSNPFVLRRDSVPPLDALLLNLLPYPIGTSREYQVQFRPQDTLATSMRYEFWTGPGQTGTRLAGPLGCTNGLATLTPYIYDPGIVDGDNPRYLRTRDGAGNWHETEFILPAVLQVPQEITVEIEGESTVDARVTTASLVEPAITGTSTVEARVTAPALIEATIHGSADVVAGASAPAGIEATIHGGAWVNVRLLPAAYIEPQITGWATVDARVTTATLVEPTIDGVASVASGLTVPAGIVPTITGSATVSARVAMVPEIEVAIHGQATVEAEVSFRADIAVSIQGRAIVEASLMEYVNVGGSGLRADLFDVAGNPLDGGPLLEILGGGYEAGLDEIGAFEIVVPAIDPALHGIDDGTRINLYRAGEGLVFRGIVGPIETTVTPDNRLTATLRGMSIAQELAWASTLVGTEYLNVPLPGVVADLIAGTGWTAYGVASDPRNVTAQYTGASVWQAAAHAAQMFGWHVRERNLTRQIEVGPLGADSGLVFAGVDHVDPRGESAVHPIAHITITDQQDDLWNRVVPIGGGDGVNALTLQYSDRTSPYTIQQGTDRAGNPYWYLEDQVSIARHGARERVVAVSDLVPLSNSPAEIRNAANALYDVAAASLGWYSQVRESYQVDVLGLRHVTAGQVQIRAGDKARLRYRGVVETRDGVRVWRDIDRDVWILGYARQFDEDGVDRWSLKVSTVDRDTPDDSELVAQALESLWAIQTAKRPYTINVSYGPYRESIDAGDSARFPVRISPSITWLHAAELEVMKSRVKSNVTGSAAGGGQTSTASVVVVQGGGGVTSDAAGQHSHAISTAVTPSGGGHTSHSGSPHTHIVTGETTAPGGLHAHLVGQYQGTNPYVQPAYMQTIIMQTGPLSGPNYGFLVGRNGIEGSSGGLWTQQNQAHTHQISGIATQSEDLHTHGILNHTHTVQGQTAISGGEHRHSMPLHTHAVNPHDHEIQDHTHALIYGVFRGPNPTAPQMRVLINGTDRTDALGGPWDSDFVVDITAYLVDGQGQPLRRRHDIEITSEQLMDATVTVQALCSLTSVVPVG